MEMVNAPEAWASLKPHDHLCLTHQFYDEWRSVIIPFLARGLQRGEKCLYLASTHTTDEIRRCLAEDGAATSAAEASGQLVILHEDAARSPAGILDIERLVAMLTAEVERAAASDYPVLRVAGEMLQAFRGQPDSDRLFEEFAARVDQDVFPGLRCVATSPYDQWTFDPSIAKGAIMTYHIGVHGNRVYYNFYCVPLGVPASAARDSEATQRQPVDIERDYQDRTHLLSDALERSAQPFAAVRPNCRFIVCNAAFGELTGYAENELRAMERALDLVPPEWMGAVHEALDRLHQTGQPQRYENEYIRKDGSRVPVESLLDQVRGADGDVQYYFSFVSDISERKRTEDNFRQLAYHDALTGLPNRALFNDRLNVALAHSRRYQQRLAVMLLDLDYFKEVNDTLGHTAGDQLLQAVSERLTAALRQSDTVARMGGDEFLILLPETVSDEDATSVAAKMIDALREPLAFGEHTRRVTASIGIAMFSDDGADVEALLKAADIAMYRAKESGRDNYQRYTVGE